MVYIPYYTFNLGECEIFGMIDDMSAKTSLEDFIAEINSRHFRLKMSAAYEVNLQGIGPVSTDNRVKIGALRDRFFKISVYPLMPPNDSRIGTATLCFFSPLQWTLYEKHAEGNTVLKAGVVEDPRLLDKNLVRFVCSIGHPTTHFADQSKAPLEENILKIKSIWALRGKRIRLTSEDGQIIKILAFSN